MNKKKIEARDVNRIRWRWRWWRRYGWWLWQCYHLLY